MPQTTVQWWRQLESDLAGVDRAIEREYQAAVTAGKPWPPERTPQPQSEPVREPENSPGSDPEAYGRSGPDDQLAKAIHASQIHGGISRMETVQR